MVELLERSHELAALAGALDAVAGSARGRIVLLSGEAGSGKTALLHRFREEHGRTARLLTGACDPLYMPRPLGPLLDVAEATGGELERLVTVGARPHEVAAALTRELRARTPTVLVLEDLHWADEATLDVLTLLGRRPENLPALVVLSYRDDELGRTHPLRLALAEFAPRAAAERLVLGPLSESAVAALAEPHDIDGSELWRRTGGNPFFVTEVLGAGGAVPGTVRDAVLARSARLSPPASQLLEAVAVAPGQLELSLIEGGTASLEECLASGMLTALPNAVAFRHELARVAIEESLPPNRRLALHRALLDSLGDSGDARRLAYHADAAGDTEAVLRFAPTAAERAARVGAHREAASQYGLAVAVAASAPIEVRAELLERYAYELYLTGRFDDALVAQRAACDLRSEISDPTAEGDALRVLSRLLRFIGRTAEAAAAGNEAVALLEPLGAGHELAMAYANLAHIFATGDDAERTLSWGTRARELAEELGDSEVLTYVLTSIGCIDFRDGRGTRTLERSLAVAREADLDEHTGRALLNLVWWAVRQHEPPLVDRYLDAGLEFCSDRGLDLWRLFLIACRARSELDRGRWTEAGASAARVLGDPRIWPVPRVFTLSTLGTLRARRGDPGIWELLDEARALADPTGELQRIGPAAVACAEAAWLEDDHPRVLATTEGPFALALDRNERWFAGHLACWRRRAGSSEEIAASAVAPPQALELAGDWAGAAALWEGLGYPYEAALARADGDEDALRRALSELQQLGARTTAAIVVRRLRERGARGVPRGPRPVTRTNPAGLTPRELEVLALLVAGLRNSEVADELVLSVKTVDHHVASILRKLGVRSRGEAATAAVAQGLVAQDR